MTHEAVHTVISGKKDSGKSRRLALAVRDFSEAGIPVFICDTKREVAGLLESLAPAKQLPITVWDVYGESGIPLRSTVSDLGPLLMARLLDLNALQEGVLRICYRMEDERGYMLHDLDDLQALCAYLSSHMSEVPKQYGQISPATLGAISRRILSVQDEKGDRFFGEPALEIYDLMRCENQRGMIHILDAEELHTKQKLYSTVVYWLLAELVEEADESRGDEIGMIFAIDRADDLINGVPASLKNEFINLLRQAGRRGIKIIFVSDDELTQGSNVRAEIGEFLEGLKNDDAKKSHRYLPSIDRKSTLYRKYSEAIDRHSAKEILAVRAGEIEDSEAKAAEEKRKEKDKPSYLQKMTNSAMTTIGRELGKELIRGIMGILKR